MTKNFMRNIITNKLKMLKMNPINRFKSEGNDLRVIKSHYGHFKPILGIYIILYGPLIFNP